VRENNNECLCIIRHAKSHDEAMKLMEQAGQLVSIEDATGVYHTMLQLIDPKWIGCPAVE
jgi:hypothetical protein